MTGSSRTLAILGVIKCELNSVHRRRNDHATVGRLESVKFGQSIQREMQLGDIAMATQPPYLVGKTDVEVFDADELQKSPLRVRRGNDPAGFNFRAVDELHTIGNKTADTRIDKDAAHRA